jgi:hypothetical protein
MKYISTLFKCVCWSEGLEVGSDEDGVSVCMWGMGAGPYVRDVWTRIKWAWRILRRDEYYHDECILSPETARAMAASLLEHAERSEKAQLTTMSHNQEPTTT